ncbi:hypothetical protein L211DRAFT_853609 [Terfezia boudieri ATCC MYA-4762]|uniref:Uncharacterized protein n=1 Tax=Terfezia boudieri ATCC MYA-4762 TaxID=1051890 RepID=A0A3N4L7Y9_9PEZI|nr:hypothetical protein L211DRAFT_853609 [Terfezia boudieri ATCC MYA-4762]
MPKEPTGGNESTPSFGKWAWAHKAISDVWPSPETLAALKKQALKTSTESFYKAQEELLAKGTDVKSAFLEFPATKAVISQAATALDSVELEAHKSFCNCINDPGMKDLAIQFQTLNKQTSKALENVKAHPTALDARETYNELSKKTTEAYAALINQSSAARDAVNIVQKAVEQVDTMCREQPVLCGMVAAGLVMAISPSMILGPVGFDEKGPRKRSWAAFVQSKVYSAMAPKDSLFGVLQSWGMVGMPGDVMVRMVGGPVVALLLAQMKRDWSSEGCKKLTEGVGEREK